MNKKYYFFFVFILVSCFFSNLVLAEVNQPTKESLLKSLISYFININSKAASVDIIAVDGVCGVSNGITSSVMPTNNLCVSGAICSMSNLSVCDQNGLNRLINGDSQWVWTCNGSNGGVSANCSAPKSNLVNGVCGSANGGSFSVEPKSSLCTVGTVCNMDNVGNCDDESFARLAGGQGGNSWLWTCNGSNGGVKANCSASKSNLVNGACGSANGGSFYVEPKSSLCNVGTVCNMDNVGNCDNESFARLAGNQGGNSWLWTCNGSNGGVKVNCSASKSNLVNGACGSANGKSFAVKPTVDLCSTGVVSIVSGSDSWSWTCNGSNGGANASCFATASVSTEVLCTDSDNGKDYFKKGSVNWGPISGKYYSATDGCDNSGKTLSEHYCYYSDNLKGNYSTVAYYTCPNGCSDGACIATSNSSITVISPNGGEKLIQGKIYMVEWESTGVDKVMIQLDKESPNTGWHLTYDTPASLGKFAFSADGKGTGDDYKISIWDSKDIKVIDSSDNYFSISSGSAIQIDGVCGLSNGGNFVNTPTAGLCNSGGASSPYLSGTGLIWMWTCSGSGMSGLTVSCSANKIASPIDGICGSVSGTSTPVTPTMNLCSNGDSSRVESGDNSWVWSCGNVKCSAKKGLSTNNRTNLLNSNNTGNNVGGVSSTLDKPLNKMTRAELIRLLISLLQAMLANKSLDLSVPAN